MWNNLKLIHTQHKKCTNWENLTKKEINKERKSATFQVFWITIQYVVAILEHIRFKNKTWCYISQPDTNPYDWGATIPTYFTQKHKLHVSM